MKTSKCSVSILAALVMFCMTSVKGQLSRVPYGTDQLKTQIQGILSLKGTKTAVTDTIFDKKLDSVLNKVSGLTYKEGKAGFSSATVDDKGITINLKILDNSWQTLQVSIAGEAKDKFVNLFSKGSYGRTLSGGLTWNLFPRWNLATIDNAGKISLDNKIAKVVNEFEAKRSQCIGLNEITDLVTLFRTHGRYIHKKSEAVIDSIDIASYDEKISKLKNLLKKYKGYLPKDFDEKSLKAQQIEIGLFENSKTEAYENFSLQKELDTINNLQLGYDNRRTWFFWGTIGAKINNDQYPVFDIDKPKTDYVRTTHDNFIGLTGSANILLKTKGMSLWISPTFRYKNAREFDTDNLKFLDLPKETQTIDGKPLVEYKQISYYQEIAARKDHYTAELPFMLFFPKAGFGFDLAINHRLNYEKEKWGGRFGVFVPIGIGTEQLIIEPLWTLKKLDQKDLDFWKDQSSIGVSITVTIPKFVSNK
ncbi:hypothetical protein [Pedobacter caeni]|uniref:Uncharacterized protein n=1 Tax=Pedobacter caeni TaxID=288992 RepID=A0A1M5KSF8_9SPHI|nr:hypothetical protein [Pedobacter caeni]SHG55675.1 hypothetical protein SAMN04488522_10673 [Pedobacter caeni]